MRRWPLATAIGVLDTAIKYLRSFSCDSNIFSVAYLQPYITVQSACPRQRDCTSLQRGLPRADHVARRLRTGQVRDHLSHSPAPLTTGTMVFIEDKLASPARRAAPGDGKRRVSTFSDGCRLRDRHAGRGGGNAPQKLIAGEVPRDPCPGTVGRLTAIAGISGGDGRRTGASCRSRTMAGRHACRDWRAASSRLRPGRRTVSGSGSVALAHRPTARGTPPGR
jgi:hypothetical protein